MVKTTDLVAAMRCSSQAPTSSPPCTTCAYRVVESLDGKEYTSCDCDRMGMDAADKIEELVERCARYAEEIAVLRERMRTYEETGLTADVCAEYRKFEDEVVASGKTFGRLLELLRADTAGRVVVLPCKVGDTVYILRRTFDGADVVGEAELWWDDIPQLGKTVFLTREEAEKALEAMRKGKTEHA